VPLSLNKPKLDNLANENWIHECVTGQRRITEADGARVEADRHDERGVIGL
jgi:hypothetical protein